MTSQATLVSAPARVELGNARISAIGLVKSEWTKLWSVRSLWITLTVAFALTTALCSYLIFNGQILGDDEGAGDIPFGWTAVYPIGMLILVILGVLTITSEYSTGSIRSSLVAAPRRTGLLLSKAAVLTAVTTTLGALMSVLLYAVLQSAGTVPLAQGMSLFDPQMLWGVLGGTMILPYGVLLGLALGGLLRNAAAAIALYFGVFQLGPQLFPVFLPEGLAHVVDYMPLAALDVMRSGGLSTEPYGVGVAIVVLLAWLVVLGGSSWWLLKKRDV
ncbi:ABC transporter permease [Paramicrobacterium fandaimingii]|uniref:ABC transporter permease n=1 Tax=Paramicrobacterium fandaimingii TaxID=2708079 RepID=UPI00141FCC3A|nr:ABC transporter permease [Microbacterium fandaimingii]